MSKERINVNISLREAQALMAALAIGVIEIQVHELLTGRAMIALHRGVAKIEEAEKRLLRSQENV